MNMDKSMDAVSLIQHVERDMEATSFPGSVTADWLEEDGNETTWNQFQQPDWQVGENGRKLDPGVRRLRLRKVYMKLLLKYSVHLKKKNCVF